MTPTVDPSIFIEHEEHGYVRYWCTDGRRWEVLGTCDRRGDCLVGAVIDTPDGPAQIESKEHLAQLCKELGRERIDSELDVPVGPGFSGCCDLQIHIS